MTDTEVGSVYVSIDYKVNSAGLAKAESDAVAMAGRVSNINWNPPTFKSPVMDLRAAEAAGMNMGNSVGKGMTSGLSGTLSKAEAEVSGSMGRMRSTMLQSSGMFVSVASAAGPIGIGVAAVVGGSILMEQAA